MCYKHRGLFIFLWFLNWSNFFLYSQQLPYIQRFKDIQEFEAVNDPIVKTILQSNDGRMYFGKRTGLYSLTSTVWEKIYSTSKEEVYDVQLLEKDSLGRIWVISKSGIGFIKNSDNGIDSLFAFRLKNDSLFKDSDPKKIIFHENKIFILNTNNEVLWIPMKYVNEQIKLSEPQYFKNQKFSSIFKLGNRLFFFQIQNKNSTQTQNGLFEYIKQEFVPVKTFPDFIKNRDLKAFIQLNSYRGLLCFDKEYYWFDGKDFKEISLENSNLLSNGIVAGAKYDNNSIVISTFYEGSLIYDIHSGALIKQINPKNGYNEGEIFSIHVDKEKGIWIGGKTGLVRVSFKDYLQDYQNLSAIKENVNDVYAFGRSVLFATNNGLYLVESNKKSEITHIYSVPELKDVVCHQIDIFDFDETILIATNNGLYEFHLEDKKAIKVLADPVQKILSLSEDFALIVSSFEIKLIEKDSDKWKKPIPFAESTGIINSITFDTLHSHIWIGTDKGVMIIEIDDDFNKTKKLGTSLVKYGKNEVKKIFGKPYAINKNGAFIFNIENKKFEKDQALSKFINDRTKFTQWMEKMIVYHKNEYLILSKQNNEILIDTLLQLANIAQNPYQIIADNDRQIFIFTKDNVLRFNINVYKNYQKFYAQTDSTHQTKIYKLLINDNPVSLTEPNLLFEAIHNLELYFGGNNFENYGTFLFQYYIEGLKDHWSDWKRDKKLVLNGLSYGSYTIHVRIKDNLGRIWNEAKVSFEIVPPFYATTWAIMLYIFLGILLIFLIVKFYSANLEKIIKQRTADLETQKAIAIKEREFAEEQKKIAEEKNNLLIQANEELKISMETIQNQQEQLIRQEKMAALGQLVANTAHELNTPIGAIQNSIQNIQNSLPETFHQLPILLQKLNFEEEKLFFDFAVKAILEKKNLSSQEEWQNRMKIENQLFEKQIPFADEIAEKLVSIGLVENLEPLFNFLQNKIEYAHEIIHNLYMLGRIGTNLNVIQIASDKTKKKVQGLKVYTHSQKDESLTDFLLIENIETVITVYSNHFKHDIELVRNYLHEPKLQGFPDQLMQVWTNLIFNAIQAMGGKGRIIISVEQNEKYAFVKIEDNGPGIPIEIQDKIFQPLFTTKAKGEGSGLGLSIVQKIIEKHKGNISFQSQPGKTIFTVQLPLHQNLNN